MSQLHLNLPSGSSETSEPQSRDPVSIAFARFANVAETVKEYCPQIRVLVMGKRNAGKTTLLKKMTHSSDGQVTLRNQDGDMVNPGTILEPSVERGESRIDWEITYPSDSNYVFHDSRGMEAGSDQEVQFLRNFMHRRRNMNALKNRLHVIWFCLPVDNDRPFGPHEMAFFENAGTGGVAIIAIFTKFEWRITKAYDILRQAGIGHTEAKKEAPQLARDDMQKIVQQRFHDGLSHRPIEYIFLQDMDQDRGNCDELARVTARVVQSAVNNHLFSAIKHSGVRISMAIALVNAISITKIMTELMVEKSIQLNEWTIHMLLLFPYWDVSHVVIERLRRDSGLHLLDLFCELFIGTVTVRA
ncbi:hypothetical protein BDP27DRAFT_527863 [Rhodocollybia butyracea]|uniref:G domain-containing protein n=1 Tax=Rhodocollybia butyracea TaxID=206335 RepID=A0A9P5P559_9AGAR|nr:hypothetical protein BDP27DRAFT_527863 [Rhodocollybia butyracea]